MEDKKSKYVRCFTCRSRKLPSSFGIHRGRANGLQLSCKKCNRKNALRWYYRQKAGKKAFKETREKILNGVFKDILGE